MYQVVWIFDQTVSSTQDVPQWRRRCSLLVVLNGVEHIPHGPGLLVDPGLRHDCGLLVGPGLLHDRDLPVSRTCAIGRCASPSRGFQTFHFFVR